MNDHIPTSVAILREQGPMNLRDLTGETVRRLGANRLLYRDVNSVMETAQRRGLARVSKPAADYRDQIWKAV